jgi:type VI secretion system protein VasD
MVWAFSPRALLAALGMLASVALAGCGSAPTVRQAIASVTMRSAPEQAPRPVKIPLRIQAGRDLNQGSGAAPLGLLLRFYYLKDPATFNTADFSSFLSEDGERTVLGENLLARREVLLIPGQRYETTEVLPVGAGYLGVVAVFQTPVTDYWRYSFEASQARETGLALAANACTLTVSVGEPIDLPMVGSAGPCP